MKRFQALSLDLDGTLLDGRHFQESIVGTCVKIAERQPELDMVELTEANARASRGYWPEIEGKWTLGALKGESVRTEMWRRTLRACGCFDESMVRFASGVHRDLERETYQLFEDARELAARVRDARIPLVLITNGAADTQREKLRALGIEEWFDAVVISGEVGIAKPDPAVFSLAVKGLSTDPEDVWHVGDSLTTDVAGAKGAGLTAVWLNRTERARRKGDPEPDFEIRSLFELMTWLAE